ncbi:hypothetical protein [Amycolatopsis sp. NPDC051903]|uniref:hypothetical protein n=1 Tax=Amycolatopsis sp. NPDC051903 TaxID=3363936 RepID=UPI0037A28432
MKLLSRRRPSRSAEEAMAEHEQQYARSMGELLDAKRTQGVDPIAELKKMPVPPVRGWAEPGGGRAQHVGTGASWQGTTTQLAGLYPFVGGQGVDVRGVPIGYDMTTHEPVGFHPAHWLIDGLISNTGIWVQAQPGVGKSTFAKRLALGLVGMGWQFFNPADLKGEYTRLVHALHGVVLEVRRGRHRINPLDPGPLQAVIRSMAAGPERQAMIDTIHARQIAVLEGLLTIVMRRPPEPTESLLLTCTLRELSDAAEGGEVVIPQVLHGLRNPSVATLERLMVSSWERYADLFRNMIAALENLADGALRGLFDGPSSYRPDPDCPAISLDISALDDEADEVVAAAMLCAWSWGGGLVETQKMRAEAGGQRRNILWNQDEMWRALRTGHGLVEKSDAMTRLNRQKGVASVYLTHSMSDLEALPTEQDRKKAKGIASRCQVHIYGGMPLAEAEMLPTNLSEAEIHELTTWQSSGTYHRGQQHPGRGRLLVKAGERTGLPVTMTLHPEELKLYDTDTAWAETNWSKRGE